MAHWLDRLAIAAAHADERRISRRDALRSSSRIAGTALAGTAMAGTFASEALAAGNDYCLPACRAKLDNDFNRWVATCKANYLKSYGTGADAVDLIDCLVEGHRGMKVGLARCNLPFCGDKKRYPPRRPAPVPKHVPPTKPPPPPPKGGGSGSGGGTGAPCGPGVFCDANQLCCTTSFGGQTLQFCVSKNPAVTCSGKLTGPT